MSESPAVAAALLNWNGWRDTIACLETLARVRYPALDLYLCDNASSDDSIDRIRAWAKTAGWEAPRFTLIANDVNAGFTRGTNIGSWSLTPTPVLYNRCCSGILTIRSSTPLEYDYCVAVARRTCCAVRDRR